MPATNWTPPPTRWSASCSGLGDRVPVHEKARAEMLVADARQAVKDSAPLDRVRSPDRRTAADLPRPGGDARRRGGPTPTGGDGSSGASAGDDDVIDADFTVS